VIAALVALGLVVGIALAGVLWVGPTLSYDAVEAGRFDAVGDRGSRIEAGPFGSYVAKRYVGGGDTTAVMSIINGGDRDVEIVELGDITRGGAVALEQVAVGPPPRYAPFEPFDLASGEQRAVLMRFRMGSCDELDPGATVTVSTLLVRYRTGFAERGENIELRSPIEFRRTEDCGAARGG
jgi:hypothetical protein